VRVLPSPGDLHNQLEPILIQPVLVAGTQLRRSEKLYSSFKVKQGEFVAILNLAVCGQTEAQAFGSRIPLSRMFAESILTLTAV